MHWKRILTKWATRNPDGLAYQKIDFPELEGRSITYRQLESDTAHLAGRLGHHSEFQQPVVLLYRAGIDFVTALLACFWAGRIAVPLPLPYRLSQVNRLAKTLTHSGAKLVLTDLEPDSELFQGIRAQLSANGAELLWHESLRKLESTGEKSPKLDPASPAVLQYSSGSTGSPKGVIVTHQNLVENCKTIAKSFGTHAGSRYLTWLPHYHDMGLVDGVLGPLAKGIPGHIMAPEDFIARPVRWLQAISKYRITCTGGPNFAFELCARKVKDTQKAELNLSSLDVLYNGAEPIWADTLNRFAKAFQVCGFRYDQLLPCYGMAESTLMVSSTGRDFKPKVLDLQFELLQEQHRAVKAQSGQAGRSFVSSGRIASGFDVKIVDPKSRSVLPEWEVGEIWISGDSVAQGYYGDLDKTDEIFHAETLDGQGPYLRSEDLGFLADGWLYITGRIKDLIILNGQNHYPQDIEKTASDCHIDIRTGNVAAFPVVDGQEERVVVMAELRSEDRADEVRQKIQTTVYQTHGIALKDIALVPPGTIRKTSSGKLMRFACRDLWQKSQTSTELFFETNT
ncbi:fatty acyl-AMP ligase [Pontibacter sp. G13]|uniref:fatty acyl-AMP ligase n=1 Tax=Pontibacter sp. G13 TaxID=3074898 RepID=UPI00288AD631|nr:fatty acyl-AMP ligase [Pontibacter sp. G13]WNJ19784.1 fatty acyl-AMP ligase [Pontibacter sp. G13]